MSLFLGVTVKHGVPKYPWHSRISRHYISDNKSYCVGEVWSEGGEMCSPEQHYKLPNELIDACVVYGLDRKCFEDLQSRYSDSKVR